MILTKELEIKVNPKNIVHLKSIGYTGLTVHQNILVPVDHLSKGSGYILDIICDVCGKRLRRSFHDYNKSVMNGGYFACSNKCSYGKKQKKFIEKYGVEHLLQSKSILEIMKNNNISKYGIENVNQSEIVKLKKKETFLKKYGVENPSQFEDFKKKKEKTSFNNFGVKYHNQSGEYFKNVFKKSNKLKKYNETLYYQSSYEKHFLDYCCNIGIINEIKHFKYRIKYKYNNDIKYYFPDFYIEKLNLIIEIKSEYYYNKYIETNLLKESKCISNGYDYIFIIDKNYDDFIRKYYPSKL